MIHSINNQCCFAHIGPIRTQRCASIFVSDQGSASGFHEIVSTSFTSDSNSSVPALGLAWSHCVNTRIQLLRETSFLRGAYADNEEEEETTNDKDFERQVPVPQGVRDTSTATHLSDDNNKNNNNIHSEIGPSDATVKVAQHQQKYSQSTRKMVLQQSPLRPRAECYFEICSNGIFGIL